jgi:hypothetical protein
VIRDRIREWLGGGTAVADNTRHVNSGVASDRTVAFSQVHLDLEPADRQSRGLDQLFQSLPDRQGLSILDLGEINQENVGYVTGLGHRHYSEDLLRAYDNIFRDFEPTPDEPFDPVRVKEFLDSSMRFAAHQFDAVLVWDTLQFLPQDLLEATMERLLRIVRPGGLLLGHFHTEVRDPIVRVHGFKILDNRTLRLTPKGRRASGTTFTNRSLEKLFEGCQTVKFFLTRDSLKEVIVRR